MKFLTVIVVMTATIGAAAAPAAAKTFTIEMKNFVSGSGAMVFDPAFVAAQPGDTILFKATDKGHNVASIAKFAPAGTPAVTGKINQDVSIVLKRPGFYGFECNPHYTMGMVALVKVGAATLPAGAVDSMPPLAKKRMAALVARAN